MLNPIEYLSTKARTVPNYPCIITDSQSINYKTVLNITQKTSAELISMGLKKGDLICTSFMNPVLDFLLTLAGFQLGLVTCTLHGGFFVPENLKPKLLISDLKKNDLDTNKHLSIDNEWFRKILSNSAHEKIEEYAASDTIRLILSSGTTGTSKVIPLSFEIFCNRLLSGLSYWITPNAEINLQGLSTTGGIFTAIDRLHMGLPIYLSAHPVKLVSEHSIQSLTGSPIQISKLMDKISNSNLALNRLDRVTISGGMISARLHKRINEMLSDSIRNVYGSSEIGGISLLHLDSEMANYGAGYLLPGVQVQIMNDSSSDNDAGLINVKSPCMTTHYLNDIESTKKSFINGWFYSGDRGYIQNSGLLTISGRDNELINVGGVKVNPAIIDEDILSHPGILDAACFGIENENGITQVACAVVCSNEANLTKLNQYLIKKYGVTKAPSIFFKLKKIPRNTMGKAMRLHMTQQFTEHLKKNI